MAITAEDIQNVSFTLERKGYDVDEVDVFLERVAEEVDAMNKQIQALQAELQNAAAEPAAEAAPAAAVEAAPADAAPVDEAAQAEIADLKAQVEDLEAKLKEKIANDQAISQALIVAQRSADDIVSNARVDAANIVKDADAEAGRIVEKAELDRQKIIEAINKLESDRADVRSEYRDMLSNFMADAQRKLADIDGDARRASVAAQARTETHAASYAPAIIANGDPVPPAVAAAAQGATVAAAPVQSPSASGFIDKDFSGYGDAVDDFDFDID